MIFISENAPTNKDAKRRVLRASVRPEATEAAPIGRKATPPEPVVPLAANSAGSTTGSTTGSERITIQAAAAPEGPPAAEPFTPDERRYSKSDVFFLIFLALCMFLAIAHYHRWFGWFGPESAVRATPFVREEVQVSFLNVSAGEAILVQSPEGKNALIDGGASENELRSLLEANGVTALDTVIATHDDPDHIGGLLVVAPMQLQPERFIGNRLIVNPEQGSPLWRKLMNTMQDAGALIEQASNQTLQLGSVELTVVPPPTGVGGGQNNQSVAVRVKYGAFEALLTGDSENPQTRAWMRQKANVAGPVQVYQGTPSPVGDSADWLQYVSPANVVLQTGTNSGYIPSPDILARYKAQNAEVYATDESGTITFIGRKNGRYEIKLERVR